MFGVKCGVRGNTDPACNVVGMIDRNILGIQHLYRRPVYAPTPQCSINSPHTGALPHGAPSWCQAPFDPKGLLRFALLSRSSNSHPLPTSFRAPSNIAAAQREQASLMQAQRKMRIAHYGKTAAPADATVAAPASQEEKRGSFITLYSDPLYIAYHDDEWGVPAHDDKMLFELLVLSGAQVGLDWTTILKRRNDFRATFSEFEAEMVVGFTESQIASVSLECGLDLARVRGFVDNANRILEENA